MQLNIIEPSFKSSLPEWGIPIIKYVSEHILVTANQLNKIFWPKGSRKGKKQLFNLARCGHLMRYEIETSKEYEVAYTLGPEGIRLARRIIPDVNIQKAQELLVANEFLHTNKIYDFNLWVGKSLLIGDLTLDKDRYALWCPVGNETRTSSLKTEVGLKYQGLIVVAPTLKYVYDYIRKIDGFFPVHYTTRNLLNEFLSIEGVKAYK
jgi:hypothetical protein